MNVGHTCKGNCKLKAEIEKELKVLCAEIGKRHKNSQTVLAIVEVRDWSFARTASLISEIPAQDAPVPCAKKEAQVKLSWEEEFGITKLMENFAEAVYDNLSAACATNEHGVCVRVVVFDKDVPSGGFVCESNANWQLWGDGAMPAVTSDKLAEIGTACPKSDDKRGPW